MSPAKRPKRAESPKGRAGRAAVRKGASPRSGSGRERPGAAPAKPGRPGRPKGKRPPARGARPEREADRGSPTPSSYQGGRGRPSRGKSDRGLGGDQVEGRQAVRELLVSGNRKVRELLVADDQDDSEMLSEIAELALELKVTVREVSRRSLLAAARTEAPQGVVAKAAPLDETDLDDLAANGREGWAPFLVAADGVTDPGNLGALLRSAEGAGATGVVLPRHRAVHITPTAAKAAAGAIEHLPMAVVGGLPAALMRLRELGVWVVGLDAGGDESLFEIDFVASEPVCVVLGAEGKGLSRLVRQRCDAIASLPLLGNLASLNVSAAGAIACFEITRRRQLTQS